MSKLKIMVIGLLIAAGTLGNVAVNIWMPARAFANPVITTSAYGFLESAAAAAGLSTGDFVATVAGTVLTAKGMSIANDAGVKLGSSGVENLENLIEAADYPDYYDLSINDQQAWGTKQNYDAAKFNSLLSAFGMGDDVGRYYTSGGNNFEFSDDVLDTLQRFGRIGNNWITGIGNIVGDIVSLITNSESIDDYFIVSESDSYDAENISDWPSGVPRNGKYAITNFATINVTYKSSSRTPYRTNLASEPVYCIAYETKTSNSGNQWVSLDFFSKEPFQYATSYFSNSLQTVNTNANYRMFNGHDIYFVSNGNTTGTTSGSVISSTVPVNYFDRGQLTGDMFLVIYDAILYGDILVADSQEKIPEYPIEPVPSDERVYIPSDGVNNTNTWNTYLTPSTINRPTNNYNPGKETETPEWKDETTANVIPLFDVHFDKLFPFCLLFDIRDLFEKVKRVTDGESQSGNYQQVTIPLKAGSFIDETIVLDLSPVYNLLVMVRPFVQILLAAGLLFVTVRFWQGILTG